MKKYLTYIFCCATIVLEGRLWNALGQQTLANSKRQEGDNMSVNLYLKNEVRNLPGFKTERYKDDSGEKITFKGVNFCGEKGRIYAMWTEDSPIPDEFKDFVDEISFYQTIPQMGRRESGVYRHESARCELTPGDHGNNRRDKPIYLLKISAKNLEDIQELLHKIKTGSVRPDESYEAPQGGESRAELETTFNHLEKVLKLLDRSTAEQARLTLEVQDLQAAGRLCGSEVVRVRAERDLAQNQIRAVLGVFAKFNDQVWPWCLKSKVGTMINLAVNDTK